MKLTLEQDKESSFAVGDSYRPEIDGLRAIAVAGVILSHAEIKVLSGYQVFEGGYVGVDVFFVISGFLITRILMKELTAERFSILNFWERRIRRILPALFFVIAVTFLAGWVVLLPEDFTALARSIVAVVLFGANFHFWKNNGYFASEADEQTLLHTWSLAVEEQFYFLIPFLLMLLARIGKLRWASKVLLVCGVASFLISIDGTYRAPQTAFYLLPSRAWEFIVGCLLARVGSQHLPKVGRLGEVASALGLLLVLIPFFTYTRESLFPGALATLPVFGSAMVIWSGGGSSLPLTSRLISSRPFVFVGLISYSLYLWHWPIFVFARYGEIGPPSRLSIFLSIVASFVIAIVSWRYVESPFRGKVLLSSQGKTFVCAVIAAVAILLIASTIIRQDGFEDRIPDAARNILKTGKQDPRWWRSIETEDIEKSPIRFGVDSKAPALAVWGDSHAMSILPAMNAICNRKGVSGVAITHWANPPCINFSCVREDGWHSEIRRFNATAVNWIRENDIEVVLLAAFWEAYPKNTLTDDSDSLADALLETVTQLRRIGVKVYFMRQVPVFEFDVPKTIASRIYSNRGFENVRLPVVQHYETAFQDSVMPRLKSLGVTILDPVPALLTRTRSRDIVPYDANGCFYYDRDHLSEYGAMCIQEIFADMVDRLK
jgi:peptidoglycan/LPS O-acetylase OafA/YrhL